MRLQENGPVMALSSVAIGIDLSEIRKRKSPTSVNVKVDLTPRNIINFRKNAFIDADMAIKGERMTTPRMCQSSLQHHKNGIAARGLVDRLEELRPKCSSVPVRRIETIRERVRFPSHSADFRTNLPEPQSRISMEINTKPLKARTIPTQTWTFPQIGAEEQRKALLLSPRKQNAISASLDSRTPRQSPINRGTLMKGPASKLSKTPSPYTNSESSASRSASSLYNHSKRYDDNFSPSPRKLEHLRVHFGADGIRLFEDRNDIGQWGDVRVSSREEAIEMLCEAVDNLPNGGKRNHQTDCEPLSARSRSLILDKLTQENGAWIPRTGKVA